jgi:hypothetical protein
MDHRFYSGPEKKRNPPLTLCMVQASLNYGVQAMYALPSPSFFHLHRIQDGNNNLWRSPPCMALSTHSHPPKRGDEDLWMAYPFGTYSSLVYR